MADKKFRHYNIEGTEFDVPLVYNDMVHRDLEEYPDIVETPIYTKAGYRIVLCLEDACEFAEAAEPPRCIECAECKFFDRVENSLLGVCRNEKRKS